MSKFAEIKDLTQVLDEKRWVCVGDLHGCLDELQEGLNQLNFGAEDVLISVGDLTDRGPKSYELIEFCRDLQNHGRFYSCRGNHDDRFMRYLKGRPVKIKHGLQVTLDDIHKNYSGPLTMEQYKESLLYFFKTFPRIIKVKDTYIVHAGFNPYNPPDQQTKEDCIFMRFFGGKDYFDNINGKYWFTFLSSAYPRVMFGHEYIDNADPLLTGQVIALDGGCVFGEHLRIWDSRDNKVHSIRAFKQYHSNQHKTLDERLNASKIHYQDNKEIL